MIQSRIDDAAHPVSRRLIGLDPVMGNSPRVLILGSMPGAKSLAAGQYYAHSGNAFWRIMEALDLATADVAYDVRTAQLTSAGIALWDSLQSCERTSSLDSDIRVASEIGNDFVSFFSDHPTIQAVFFNGAKAERAFRRHALPALQAAELQIPLLERLPSTSPAHAVSLTKKTKAWRVITEEL